MQQSSSQNARSFRSCNERHTATIGDRTFPVAASRLWNTLPPNVTSASPLTVFRKRLKTHLFNRPPHPNPLWCPCSECHFGQYSGPFYLLTYSFSALRKSEELRNSRRKLRQVTGSIKHYSHVARICMVAPKVSHGLIIKKSHLTVLKPANKIIFLSQIKVLIEHYNIFRW